MGGPEGTGRHGRAAPPGPQAKEMTMGGPGRDGTTEPGRFIGPPFARFPRPRRRCLLRCLLCHLLRQESYEGQESYAGQAGGTLPFILPSNMDFFSLDLQAFGGFAVACPVVRRMRV
jgi:hypothetical protein